VFYSWWRGNVAMSEVQLSLELAGDAVDLDSIAETARDLQRALRDIERHVTDAEPTVTWRWDDEAVLRAAATPNGVGEPALRQIVHELRIGFKRAEEADGSRVAWPETFGAEAKKAVNRILSQLDDLDYITVSVEGAAPLKIEQVVIRREIGSRRGYSEITSVDGLLDLISVRGRPSFTIEEHGTGKRIRCIFPDSMLQVVKDALGHRAVVEGTVRFREDGTPISISDVTSLMVRPEPRPIGELLGALPNFTGDLTAVEYIRQLRSGNDAH